jgi:hypothetical protein
MALFDGYGSNNKKINMNSKYITKENSKKLLNEILLSIKSTEDLRLRDEETYKSKSDKEIHEIRTYSIDVKSGDENVINGYSLKIKKWETIRWFRTVPVFSLKIDTSAPRYKNEHELEIEDHQDIIKEIYDYLINIEENRREEEANKTLSSIINDISTTVDRSYRRDETIDEILN